MGKATRTALDVLARVQGELRAVIYVRVSTEEQAKGYGIAYTEKKCVKHIERKGWAYVRTYADEGYSGSLDHTERPELRELIADAHKTPRPFDVVVVCEERAIGRRDRAFWPWVWQLHDLGVFVAIVTGDYDNTTDDGRSRMRKAQDAAEDERITIRRRTQGGIQEKAESGGLPGGAAPYGWRIENQGKRGESRLVLEEETAVPLLRRAWKCIVLEFKNPHEVEDLFNLERLSDPTARYWPRGSLRQILKGDPIQKGERIFRNPASAHRKTGTQLDASGTPLYGETVILELDRIFSDVEVQQLNAALERTARTRTGENAVHPLSGRIVGPCGAHYTGFDRSAEGSRFYACSGKQNVASVKSRTRCTCSQIDANVVDFCVWTAVCRLLENPTVLLEKAAEWSESAAHSEESHEERIAELDRLIAEQEEIIDLAIPAAARQASRRGLRGKEAQEAVDASLQPLTKELEGLEEQRATAVAWRDESRMTASRGRDLEALAAMAAEHLHAMGPKEQQRVYTLLDIRLTIVGDIPRGIRSDDQLHNWFIEHKRLVPELTDEAWKRVESIVVPSGRGRRPADPREMLTLLFRKARTGCSWQELSDSNAPLHSWRRWSADGRWDRLMEALEDMPGVPVGSDRKLTLAMEGRIDPRLFISEDQADSGGNSNGFTRPPALPFRMTLAA